MYNEEGLIATNTLEGLHSIDVICKRDRQWPDDFVASISTFGLGRFSDAKLGQVKVQGFGAAAGRPRK